MRKVGLIDIGSNTCKLLIAGFCSSSPNKHLEVFYQASRPCRLFELSLLQQNQIGDLAINRLLFCIEEFLEICENHSVHQVRTVGTEALRKALNSSSIITKIEERTGLVVEVLSGNQEDKAIVQGLQTDLRFKMGTEYIALDIGGGSTELIEVKDNQVNQVNSLPIGAARVAYSTSDDLHSKISFNHQKKARKYARRILESELQLFSSKHEQLAATGGTIVFLRKILEKEEKILSTGQIERTCLEEMIERTCSISMEQRIKQYPDLPADRADIFPFGLMVVSEIMNFLKASTLAHSYHNLRYGLAQEFLSSKNEIN